MNRHDRDQLLSTFLWVILCLLFVVVLAWCSGCGTLKQAAWTGGGGAAGAGIGFLAPPFGPVIGAAIGAMFGGAFAVNDALHRVAVEAGAPPPAPWFLQWQTWAILGLGVFLFRNREHLLAFLKAERGRKLKTIARGLAHSVVGGKVGRSHTG